MKITPAVIALLLIPALALAQAPAPAADSDPIGALLSQQAADPPEMSEEEAETALPTSPQPYTPAYTSRPYVAPTNPAVGRPVMIHETGLSPDGPPDLSQRTYESRVRGSIAAANGLQGPLDGAWTLTGADGTKFYALQMVDPISGAGLEGAWRDLRRGAGIGGVGVIDDVQRVGGGLSLRFYPRSGETVTAQLSPTAGGGWSGSLSEPGAAATPVTLVRDGPAPAGYATLGAASYASPRPYDSTVRAAPRAPAKATVKKKTPSKKKKAPARRKRT